VATLPGEIDMANAYRVGADLDAAFGPGVGVVIADMSGTRFCDTSGIHARGMAPGKAAEDRPAAPELGTVKVFCGGQQR
jgi:STAS domain-containing protein